MVRKTTRFRRRLKGLLRWFFLSFTLFLGVFGVCFGIWYIFSNRIQLASPLVKNISQKNTLFSTIQNDCIAAHITCTNIVIASTTASISIDSDEQVIFSLQKDLPEQFSSLQLMIGHLTIEGKRFHRLDFRFDKPVISY